MTFANILPSEALEALQRVRSEGRVEVGFAVRHEKSALTRLYQSGCGRVRFPSVDHLEIPEAVLINTAGGLTGGDHMQYEVTVDTDAKLTVTGQAAEKIYKSIGPDVVIDTNLTVKDGGYLEWMPQETILFEKGRLRRLNTVKLSSKSTFLAVEATILGRHAHGEILSDASLVDGWKIWRNGKLIWFDRFRMAENVAHHRSSRALLDGAQAFATMVLAAPNIDRYQEIARATASGCKSRIGVTSFDDGLLIIRLLDTDAYSLRRSMVTLLIRLRNELAMADIPMPTVWEV